MVRALFTLLVACAINTAPAQQPVPQSPRPGSGTASKSLAGSPGSGKPTATVPNSRAASPSHSVVVDLRERLGRFDGETSKKLRPPPLSEAFQVRLKSLAASKDELSKDRTSLTKISRYQLLYAQCLKDFAEHLDNFAKSEKAVLDETDALAKSMEAVVKVHGEDLTTEALKQKLFEARTGELAADLGRMAAAVAAESEGGAVLSPEEQAAIVASDDLVKTLKTKNKMSERRAKNLQAGSQKIVHLQEQLAERTAEFRRAVQAARDSASIAGDLARAQADQASMAQLVAQMKAMDLGSPIDVPNLGDLPDLANLDDEVGEETHEPDQRKRAQAAEILSRYLNNKDQNHE